MIEAVEAAAEGAATPHGAAGYGCAAPAAAGVEGRGREASRCRRSSKCSPPPAGGVPRRASMANGPGCPRLLTAAGAPPGCCSSLRSAQLVEATPLPRPHNPRQTRPRCRLRRTSPPGSLERRATGRAARPGLPRRPRARSCRRSLTPPARGACCAVRSTCCGTPRWAAGMGGGRRLGDGVRLLRLGARWPPAQPIHMLRQQSAARVHVVALRCDAACTQPAPTARAACGSLPRSWTLQRARPRRRRATLGSWCGAPRTEDGDSSCCGQLW